MGPQGALALAVPCQMASVVWRETQSPGEARGVWLLLFNRKCNPPFHMLHVPYRQMLYFPGSPEGISKCLGLSKVGGYSGNVSEMV